MAYDLSTCNFILVVVPGVVSSCEVGLKSNQKVVGYPMMFVPLLHQWANLDSSVIL